ncbi:MAG: TerB N-terminal domain-containing protein [Acidobacteriota bacterium]|jgi:hypothetical protein|nr:TerB N-terminal domain-containing protein [Acidobacteriota bacterium]
MKRKEHGAQEATRNFTSKTYHDELLTFDEAQRENLTPPKYRAMRKLAMRNGAYRESYEKVFYKQGKFMEDFEDDFDLHEEFVQYFPTYQSMNDRQLRGYFAWRTGIRRGIIRKTSLSFAFVYIYELINQIGVRSPEEGFDALKNFWTAYREIDFRIDRYVRLWLKDYVVYNNLDKSLLEDISDTNFNNAALILLNYKSYGTDEIFKVLNSLSSYDLKNSRFFKQYPDDVKNVTCAVFSALSDYYDKNHKNTLCETFFGRFYSCSYFMFNSAVFYEQSRRKDFVYKVDDLCKFTCKDGHWSCESFFYYDNKNGQIGALLKTIDFLMRQKYNFKSALKAGKTGKTLRDIINKVIDKYLEDQREAARPKVEIDISRLQNIRKAALETQNKLLVEEPEEANAAEFIKNETVSENETSLSDIELLFMRCLLSGRAYDDQVRSTGLPLSVLVDSINEKLFDRFGDTVISETGGRPELIEDYARELKEMAGE